MALLTFQNRLPSLNRLLVNLVIRTASTRSLEYCNALAARNYDRGLYIISVLEASDTIQQQVYDACVESDSEGQLQLAYILTMFFALSAVEKVQYIQAFKVCGSLVGGALVDIAVQRTYHGGDGGRVPPYNEP